MRFGLLLFYLIIFSYSYSNNPLPLVQVNGNQFITENGVPVLFRGMSTSDPDKLAEEGMWTDRYFKEMKSWGANIVRFPVHPSAWRKRGKKAYLALLDKGIKLAEKNGLYVIIDWHSIGNLCTEKFQSDMYNTTLEETKEFWKTMAERYGNNSTVAFFELFNEPTADWRGLGPCSWESWKLLMEELISLIRSNGAKNIPLVAGFNWAYDLSKVKLNPVNAEGIAYVSHPYPQKREKPWEEKWTEDWGYVAEKYPVILTEIGYCGPDDKGAHNPVISDESYAIAITNYCKERNISYLIWVFDTVWSPMMITDWKFTPSRQGKFFKDYWQRNN